MLSSFSSSLMKLHGLGAGPGCSTTTSWKRDTALPFDERTAQRTWPDDVELGALVLALGRGVQQTDRNFLHLAVRNDLSDGCAAFGVLVYGPTSDGTMKLLSFNTGDSQAILCRVSEPNSPCNLSSGAGR